MPHRPALLLLALASILVSDSRAQGEDLSEVYPATHEFIEDYSDRVGLKWTSGPEDVWRLKSFSIEIGEKLMLKTRKAQVVFGVSEGNAAWAVVLPDRPTKFKTTSAGGLAETATSIWLRFHPSRVAELFPPETVMGPSEKPESRFAAFWIYDHKIRTKYHSGDLPTTPPEKTLLLDLDTKENRRRHFEIDLDKDRVKYEGTYVVHSTPEPPACDRRAAAKVVESAWEAFDAEYALFEQRGDVDWDALLGESIKKARKVDGANSAAGVLCDMFAALDDPDVYVTLDGKFVDRGASPTIFYGNFSGTSSVLGNTTRTKHGLLHAETPYNVGYLCLPSKVTAEEMVEELDEVLDGMQDTWAVIIDLRWMRDGDRDVMRAFAGRFVDAKRTYAYSRTRASEKDRNALGEQQPLEVEPRGDWCYDAPIHLIVGSGTSGIGEELALILRGSKQVITYGSPTAGRSLSSRWIDLDHKIRVHLPVAVDLDLDGEPVQGKGLQPDEVLEFGEEKYSDESDPLLYKVLEKLVAIPQGDRTPVRAAADEEEPDDGESAEGDSDEDAEEATED